MAAAVVVTVVTGFDYVAQALRLRRPRPDVSLIMRLAPPHLGVSRR